MNVNEFTAWFEGFQEAIGEVPTLAQWNKIKDRVANLKQAPGAPLHPTVYRNAPFISTPTIMCSAGPNDTP